MHGHDQKFSDCFEYPKQSLLKASHPQKNTCQIFLPKKIPKSKISNPKNSLDHPRHLKSGVPPPPLVQGILHPEYFLKNVNCEIRLLVSLSSTHFLRVGLQPSQPSPWIHRDSTWYDHLLSLHCPELSV